MAAINAGKVITSGLAAGLVLNVIDFASNMYIIGSRMKLELDTVNPSLWASLNDPGNIAYFVAIDFALGVMIVWLYAAIRPRFGAGPATAIKAGLFVWIVASLMWSFFYFMGLTAFSSFVLTGVISLVNFVGAAWVGGWLYAEPDSTA